MHEMMPGELSHGGRRHCVAAGLRRRTVGLARGCLAGGRVPRLFCILAGVAGIESAFLFGSWAATYQGQPGRPPGNIDVLVIGDPDRDDLDEAAQRAGARLATEVNVTIRSPRWWREGGDGFHAEVTGRPLVPACGEPGAP